MNIEQYANVMSMIAVCAVAIHSWSSGYAKFDLVRIRGSRIRFENAQRLKC